MYINSKKLKVRRFSSGELKLIRSDLDSYVEDGKVEVLYTNDFSLFELILILEYYLKKNITVDLILAYLPYQRMDHKDRDELDTINYVASIFNNMNLNSLTLCEPHCEISMFNNSKTFSYIKSIKKDVFKEIEFDEQNDIVVLTDKGGLKRYGDIARNIVYFNKVRDKDSGLIVKHEIVGNVDTSRKIVIVDDIISTGDTLVNIIDELNRLGAEKIYILSGHIENNKYNRRIFEYSSVKEVFSSNSLKKKSFKKLKLFDVKEMFY